MNKPFLIIVNNVLWTRSLTRHGALKIIERLKAEKGITGVLAYDIGNG